MALAAVACLAALAPWRSALPWWQALPMSIVALGCGSHAARREAGRQPQQIVVPWDAARAVTVDGMPVQDFHVDWRGPLAGLRWMSRDRRLHRRVLWPDVLPPAWRRELRLAVQARAVSPRPPSVAP